MRQHQEWLRSGAFGPLVGRSGGMQLVHELVGRVAPSSVPVLLTGESGTGKELVARTIHALSRREAGPFVALSCGAMPLEALEAADGGTLFLDEICDMPAAMQSGLLHALQTGSYTAVGSSRPQVIDVRLVSATNRDLAQAVAAGVLRADLFYRLNVFPLPLPPLRDRMEDLPLLVHHLLREIGRVEGAFKTISASALERLAQYDWPGNVRELRNALHQSHVMTPGPEISHPWLPGDARLPSAGGRAHAREPSVGKTLAQVEKELVLATLDAQGHHKERTAAALGISIRTLYNRLKGYGA